MGARTNERTIPVASSACFAGSWLDDDVDDDGLIAALHSMA